MDPLTAAKAAWQPTLRWCQKELKEAHFTDPKVKTALGQFLEQIRAIVGAEDAAQFQARAEGMIKQFDAFEPIPGIHINGKASLGENIADFGGILLGLDAFKKTEQYRKGGKIAGLTPIQRFFLGYALGWMTQQREEMLRRRLLSDVHAPARWRVLGPLSNIPEFYQAFGVKEGQPMWRPAKDRVRIW
jgi:putative endopeptidase